MTDRMHTYAKTPVIRRAILAIEATGFEIGMIRLAPDGTIEVVREPSAPQRECSAFDQLAAAGLLQ